MAKRVIDFEQVDTPDNATLSDVLGGKNKASQALITRKIKDTNMYEVVPQKDFDNTTLENVSKVTPMQSDLVDGGVKTNCLNQDLLLYHRHFLSEFPSLHKPQAVVGDNDNWVQFVNFPLPEFAMIHGQRKYYKTEYDDIIVVTSDYPQFPPRGVHFNENSPNLPIFRQVLGGHVFDDIVCSSSEYKENIRQLENMGWMWMCFHHENYSWNFNARDIKAGDNLYKYIEMLFARLSGAEV
jgi:hypothetical protein